MAARRTHNQPKTPGLSWFRRKDGRFRPYWVATKAALRAGWPIKAINMLECPPDELIRRCEKIQAEMLDFMRKESPPRYSYNGTIGSLITLYQTHPVSPYRKLQASSLHPMDTYLKKLKQAHGERLVCRLTGLDLLNWHALWGAPIKGGPIRVAAASMTVHCLKNALSFGAMCGYKDCRELREIASTIGFPSPEPRTQAPTAADVEAARAAAHSLGHPLAALAYAIQFETSARQWDVIGQWVPLADERPSAVLDGPKKWIGLTWASIDASLVLQLIPTKTFRTTRARVHVCLVNCPMVMDELSRIPPAQRVGPLIVNEKTGLPYTGSQFMQLWRAVRGTAGLDPQLWNRDLRAGAITEGGMAGATADDRAKLAGHSGSRTTRKVYDRDVLVSSNRVAEARKKFRGGE